MNADGGSPFCVAGSRLDMTLKTQINAPSAVFPRHLVPMAGVAASSLPREQASWAYEFKWDGVRAIAYWTGRQFTIESRNLLDVTAQYPEIADLGRALGRRQVVLDGEIVALDDHDRSSFELLQRRMHVTHAAAIERLQREVPVYYLVFDVLHLDGRDLCPLPYHQRREVLQELALGGPYWSTPPSTPCKGDQMLEAARRLGYEGIMAKRLDSLYEPGRRSPSWLKIKLLLRQEFVIGGYTPGQGGLAGGLGALLVGYYDLRPTEAMRLNRPAVLHYAGAVGTGFTAAMNKRLLDTLSALRTDRNPFAEKRTAPHAIYVKPSLLAEVEFREWTSAGILRQPSFKGLRTDKDPTDVVREM